MTEYYTEYYTNHSAVVVQDYRCSEPEYTLNIGSVSIPIEKDKAEKIVVESLPDDQLVWHINPKKGEIFYNEFYPELSLVPHPRGWVAGNIYYSNKSTALLALRQYIQNEMNKVTQSSIAQLNAMGVLRDNLSNLILKDKLVDKQLQGE